MLFHFGWTKISKWKLLLELWWLSVDPIISCLLNGKGYSDSFNVVRVFALIEPRSGLSFVMISKGIKVNKFSKIPLILRGKFGNNP